MTDSEKKFEAPHPGSQDMPQWNTGELIEAPKFTWRKWRMLLGPGLLMGGAAIGGGEWLIGPLVTAKYGGAMLWLATLSILGQVVYNIEISRYTLYSGEPIFTGKFRTPPGPRFWIVAYLIFDFGSVFPYLAASAATPLYTAVTGELPNPDLYPEQETHLRWIAYGIFLGSMIPLIFGGKIFNALKWIMSFKIVVVLGFLTIVALFYSTMDTWAEIGSGFFKFGNVPIKSVEDRNGNGKLDPGEDWDGDGKLDVIEPSLLPVFDTNGDGKKDAPDSNADGKPDPVVEVKIGKDNKGNDRIYYWPDFDGDKIPDKTVFADVDGDGEPDGEYEIKPGKNGVLPRFIDIDNDKIQDGDNIQNIIMSVINGEEMPTINWSLIAFLSALVAISGSGGLSNTPVSNYTRDQGWGMGHHVGAIPSVVGGQNLSLSHVGTVFEPTEEAMPRWKGWFNHVRRDQLAVWMPACFLGLALPSMLSVQFLARGTETTDKWGASVMTAGALKDAVGGGLGQFFWFMVLFCGFLVLAPSMAVSADGVIRRWVDAFWTASAKLRKLDPKAIRYVYFSVLIIYVIFGMTMLSLEAPQTLIIIATTIFNFALGFSCWHVLWVNNYLLPKPLRPGWFIKIALFSTGAFFLSVGTLSTLQRFVWS
jgi:hypothetical protein